MIVNMLTILIGLFLILFLLIAFGKIFSKMGEGWWKILIPVYNTYIIYKRVWSRKMFFLVMIMGILSSGWVFIFQYQPWADQALKIAGGNGLIIFGILITIISVICLYKLSVAFGHKFGWFLGFIFLPIIFFPMLAFGSSKYKGNVKMRAKNEN